MASNGETPTPNGAQNGNGEAPRVNKAVIYSSPPSIKTDVVELPIEKPGPGQVLVRLLYSGVCHTDYGFCTVAFHGLPAPTAAGQVGGHEGVGEVVELGPGVVTPAIGAKVGIKYSADACLACDRCLQGGETSCLNTKISGYYTPGTFQQYCITSAAYATPIPDSVTDLAGAAPLMCGGISVYAGLKRAKVLPGDWVLISGAGGGLGHLAIQYGKAFGVRILALDAGPKEEFCKSLGAEAFIDFTKFKDDEGLRAEVKKVTGGGPRTVLMCASSPKAYAQAVGWLGFRGTLVCLGVPEGVKSPIGGAVVEDLIDQELTIFALKSGNRQEAKECLEIVGRGLVKTEYKLRPMSDVTKIFEEMESGTISGRAVLDLR